MRSFGEMEVKIIVRRSLLLLFFKKKRGGGDGIVSNESSSPRPNPSACQTNSFIIKVAFLPCQPCRSHPHTKLANPKPGRDLQS